MSSLIIEKPDKGDTFLYLILPVALGTLIASTRLLPLDMLVSVDALILALGSLTMYVVKPDLRYLSTRMSERLLTEYRNTLEDWLLLAELTTGYWFLQLEPPPSLTDNSGHSPHGTKSVKDGLTGVLLSRVAARVIWNLRVEILFVTSLIVFTPASILVAMGILSFYTISPVLEIAIAQLALTVGAAALIHVLLLLTILGRYKKDSDEALGQLSNIVQALWLMDLIAVADVSGHEKWLKTVFSAIRPHLESVRQIIQLEDWRWFCIRWQKIADAVPSGVKREMGSVMSTFRELWADCIKNSADTIGCIQVRWLLHLLFHSYKLVPPEHQRTIETLAKVVDKSPACAQQLITIVNLFPDNLFDPEARGDKATPEVTFLANTLRQALGHNDAKFVDAMIVLVQAIESGQWPPRTEDTTGLTEAAAELVARSIAQSPDRPKTGLWSASQSGTGTGDPRRKVRMCLALLRALPDSPHRIQVLRSFVAEVADRSAIASLFSDRETVKDEEMATTEIVSFLKSLPDSGADEEARAERLRLEEEYRRRGIDY